MSVGSVLYRNSRSRERGPWRDDRRVPCPVTSNGRGRGHARGRRAGASGMVYFASSGLSAFAH